MSHSLWTIADLEKAMNARLVGEVANDVTGLSIDTRTIQTDEAYFAIKGDVHDGHKFVANAYTAGAGVSVVAEDWLDRLEGETGPLLVVDDVLAALENLGCAARARTKAKIVAVTGSVGKTTTKEALRTALSASGKVHAAVASFNNHWGVPLTLARMPKDTDFGVIEIGMNHPGEITPLVKMAQPHVAIINNVAAVHLGAFKNVDEIAHAKCEIFNGLIEGGTAVLNADDERIALQRKLAEKVGVSNIVTFGEAVGADVHMDKLVLHGTCSCLTANVMGDEMVVKVGAPGRHIAQNALAVLASCKLLGADLAKSGLALADLEAVKGRGQRHRLVHRDGRIILIDESYNANPTSMRAALALLAAANVKGRGRRIAVMGDMLELGPTSEELHAGIADAVIEHGIDKVYLAGSEMQSLNEALKGKVDTTHAEKIDELIEGIKSDLIGGDVIMAKASLGMAFARLIDDLLQTFEIESAKGA
jgi:UDP-N-acetylmuramoyl-tripeptide--D-alanyl-D-alanine ligase